VMQKVAGSHMFLQTNVQPLHCWSVMRHEKTHPFSSSQYGASIATWIKRCWVQEWSTVVAG
jgi:starvation-inducible outer membrane lipoprotein